MSSWHSLRPNLARLVAGAGLALASSCLYDPGQRCDPGQVFDPVAVLCVCDEKQNLVSGELGCVPCAEHERAMHDSCSCEEGYLRATPDAACTPIPLALGAACQSDADCTDPTYGTCHVSDGAGYCTSSGCAHSSDCAAGYGCNASATPSYCQRLPEGSGKSCASDADCAGSQATFCEYLRSKTCFVEGCSVGGNDCLPGQECCDLTGPSLGLYKRQICVDQGSCQK